MGVDMLRPATSTCIFLAVLWFLAVNCSGTWAICVENGDRPPLNIKLNCPDSEYHDFCCGSLREAINDTRCVPNPWLDDACQGGFYMGANNSTLPCPDGFYCPENALCILRCSSGAYCQRPLNVTAQCSSSALHRCCGPYYRGAERRSQAGHMGIECGGASSDFACPAGFYCPSTNLTVQCPDLHYCRRGSRTPKPCPSLATCNQGSTSPKFNVISLLISIFIGMILAGIVFVFKNRKYIRQYAQGRLEAYRLQYPAHGIRSTPVADECSRKQGGASAAHSASVISWQLSLEVLQRAPSCKQSKRRMERTVAADTTCLVPTPESGPAEGEVSNPEPMPLPAWSRTLVSTKIEVLSWLAGIPSLRKLDAEESGDMIDGRYQTNLQRCKSLLSPKKFTIGMEFRAHSLTVKRSSKKIVDLVTGCIRAAKLTAIMGGSGTGKTSMLKSLSNKAYYAQQSGEMKINGTEESIEKYRSTLGYVPQDDIMHHSLTVYEVLSYQALLRLPSSLSRCQKLAKVDNVVKLLGLTFVKDLIVGSAEVQGQISGGQRKRVNIGMELVADPAIIFLDEPTSGLDSSTSRDVIELLKFVASVGLVTVVLVIHQPRHDIFELFDDLILMEKGGRIAFQGSPAEAEVYFKGQQARFDYDDLPPLANPADYYLDVITERTHYVEDQLLEGLASEIETDTLADAWEEHAEGKIVSNILPEDCKFVPDTRPNALMQFVYFLQRALVLLVREWYVFGLDLGLVILAGGVLGAFFTEVNLMRILVANVMSGIAIGMTGMISALRAFGTPAVRPVFWRESAAGVNRVAYFMATSSVQLTAVFLYPVFFLSLYYSLLAPNASFGAFYVVFLFTYWATFGWGYFLSLLFHPDNSKLAAVVVGLISAVLGGLTTTTICKLQNYTFVGPLFYSMAYSKWYGEALFEYEAITYPPVLSLEVQYAAGLNDYSLHNLSLCLGALFAIGAVCRLLALILLMFTHRGEQK